MTDEEDVTAELLRLARPPSMPPDERAARVRAAVHRAWSAGHKRRVARRAAIAVLVAGLAAAWLIGIRIDRQHRAAAGPNFAPIVAVSERVQEAPLLVGDESGRMLRLDPSTSVRAGEIVKTDARSRAALRMADGSSLRVDRSSQVRLRGPALLDLLNGTIYIATAAASRGFEIRTALGVVRDLGTQFEIRMEPSSLRVRVRTGTVAVRHGGEETSVPRETEARLTGGSIAFRPVPSFAPEWGWAAEVAPPFEIEGRSLRAYLDHVATEQGWRITYADSQVADRAGRIILHGSVDGLSTDDAVRVALATSGLDYHVQRGEVRLSSAAPGR